MTSRARLRCPRPFTRSYAADDLHGALARPRVGVGTAGRPGTVLIVTITLREITEDNSESVLALRCTPDQERFVTSVAIGEVLPGSPANGTSCDQVVSRSPGGRAASPAAIASKLG